MLRLRARRGFAFVLVVTTAVIIAIILAMFVPTMDGVTARADASTTYGMLAVIDTFTWRDANSFWRVTGGGAAGTNTGANGANAVNASLPGTISTIVTGMAAVTNTNTCGLAYNTGTGPWVTATERTNWNALMPVIPYNAFSTTGLSTPLGTVQDALVHLDASNNEITSFTLTNVNGNIHSPADQLALKFITASVREATVLDQIVDGADGASSGKVKWTSPGGIAPLVNLYYIMIPSTVRC